MVVRRRDGPVHYRGVPEIIRTFVEEGPDTALCGRSVGIVWSDAIQTFNPGHRVPRGLWLLQNYPDAGVAAVCRQCLDHHAQKALAENGGQLLLKQ